VFIRMELFLSKADLISCAAWNEVRPRPVESISASGNTFYSLLPGVIHIIYQKDFETVYSLYEKQSLHYGM
jgi:hypothetical protein